MDPPPTATQHDPPSESIADSLTNPHAQAWALAAMAEAVAAAGDLITARAMAELAQQVARSITDPHEQARVLTQAAKAAAAPGDPNAAGDIFGRALEVARSITHPQGQSLALTAANLFFQLVSSRYERASLIVTSNQPFAKAHLFTRTCAKRCRRTAGCCVPVAIDRGD